MYPRSGRVSSSIFCETSSTRQLTISFLLFLVVIACLIASLAIGYRSVFAIGPEAAGNGLTDYTASGAISSPIAWEGGNQPATGPNVISPVDPATGGNIDSFGSMAPQPLPLPASPDQPRGVYVWAAFLCVSEYSDSDSIYLGYMPELLPTEGRLNPATFSYLDTDHRVKALYYQETDNNTRRLVLELNKPLEIDLTLVAGNMAFPFAASTTSDLGPNAHVWMLGSSLGWAPGQPVLVVLGGSFDIPWSQPAQGELNPGLADKVCRNSSKPVTSEQAIAASVWTADLVVGEASDSTRTYLGYMPSMSPPEGELSSNTFTHDGVEYTILAIFYQEIGTVRQLVLNTDRQLPDELALEFSGNKYPVADSLKLGTDGNIHAWRLDSDLGWAEGQQLEVGLTHGEG